MIDIKTSEEIKIMQQGGHILAEVLHAVMHEVKPGVSELEIDALAEKMIRERGGEPGFQKVKGYKHTICACTNEIVVHGIPSSYRFKEGDVVCIDCGVYLKGYHTDMAETIIVGNKNADSVSQKSVDTIKYAEKRVFLENGRKALAAGINEAVIGKRIGHISRAIQNIVEGEGGYSVVRSLIGHGVGKDLHEAPEVPGYLDKKIEKTPKLIAGMTIAVEVIYNMGKPHVVYVGDDDWAIQSADGSLSAVFERSIAITKEGPLLLTK